MFKVEKTNNQYLLLPDNSTLNIHSAWFSVQYWRDQDAIVTSKQGRAAAWFIKLKEDKVAVLKHYWRGGLIGKLLSDQYLYTGLEKTRVYQEFKLLSQLHALNLPVPTPIAAYVEVKLGIYRADIITEAVRGAQSLCEILQQQTASEHALTSVGRTIAQFHREGVYHDDLNINNILFDQTGQVYLIDFDKGAIRAQNTEWQKANIDRLHRSFKKEAGKWPTFFFTDANWQTLIKAYKEEVNTN
ncbi:3-deoxy-D-manno-octulosonic acid kinase [Pseudoalteromonas luteoviolacea]|uniref:3-deoxy-D-manno-octulosonic acid kinase n=1 Tax=Pseudoalteromonas luteoviolacea TaxID=43657 RepID=UPI001B36E3E5|nr:3-deoxy-D-manno-octulosonic acid kinase [Pseudoalteromonas luteoviolacea]MBQ4813532.1 3-deoxy-D-manno-octulosonic acid kinase [Pseudoalteromonas luteoviolacea]